MCGVDGRSEGEDGRFSRLRQAGGRLRRLLQRQSIYGDTLVCLLPRGDAAVCMMLWRAEDGQWKVEAMQQESLGSLGERTDQGDPDYPNRLADAAALRLAQLGWTEWPRLLLLPDGLVADYVLGLPPDMTPEEKAEAAHWEMDARLADRGWDMEQCQVVQSDLPEGDYWMAAVQRIDMQLWQQSFTEAEIPLQEMAVIAPAVVADFAVGAGIACESLYGFLHAERETDGHWDYRRLAGLWLTGVGLLLGGLLAWDSWQLYAARAQSEHQQMQLEQLAPERERMDGLEIIRQGIHRKEGQLQELSKQNFPWYSVLVHFGSMTTEGVWLDGVQLAGSDTLELQGHAVSFAALADYIKIFEQDQGFFPQGPVLETSSVEKDGVAFRLTLHL